MGAQICTLHDISAQPSVVASSHSLMSLRTLAAKTTAVSVASYFLTLRVTRTLIATNTDQIF